MRFILATTAILALLAGCAQEPREARRPALELQTIENTPPRLATLEPPAVLDHGATPTPKTPAGQTASSTSTAISEEDTMKAKTNLPFTPPIAMDPVDGSKLTIDAATPIFSYKDRWYYFSSEANKRQFAANPEQFLDQQLGRF